MGDTARGQAAATVLAAQNRPCDRAPGEVTRSRQVRTGRRPPSAPRRLLRVSEVSPPTVLLGARAHGHHRAARGEHITVSAAPEPQTDPPGTRHSDFHFPDERTSSNGFKHRPQVSRVAGWGLRCLSRRRLGGCVP